MAELNTLAPNINLPGQIPMMSPELNASEKKANEKKPQTNLNEKVNSLQNFSRDFVSIGELMAAVPLVFSSFVSQTENITKHGKLVEEINPLSYYAYIVESLAYLPRKFLDNFIISRTSEDDVSGNERASAFQDFHKRILHPTLSKEFTSFLFTFRRIIFNFFSDTFTVPSDERDPGEAKTKITASYPVKTFLEAFSRTLSPFRSISSLLAGMAMIPSSLFGVISAYNGNQKLYNISKEFSKLNDIFTPVVSNLSSLFSSTKAFVDSYSKPGKESLSVSFGRYNISYLHVVQGLLGSVLSIPYFFGILAKFKELLSQTDDGALENNGSRLSFVGYVRDIVAETAPQIKALGLFQNDSVAKIQDKAGSFARKTIEAINKYPIQILEALFNSTKFTQNLFAHIRPINHDGSVQAIVGPHTFESDSPSQNYFYGINKKVFFREMFEFLHPIQSMLMLLPNAFVPLNDPYVADNASKYMRGFDRLIGINSIIFSVPNYLIYALSTRVPQMIMKYHQWQYRRAQERGENYNPMEAFRKTTNLIKSLPLLGLNTYLAGVLEKLMTNFNNFTFTDEDEMSNVLSEIEEDARSQEASVKASELVGAIRIGFRTLLGKGWFYAKRDEQTGWTDEEKNSMKIYDSLGTFKEGINKFPVIGWVVGPFINMFRKLYYIAPKTNRKILQTA